MPDGHPRRRGRACPDRGVSRPRKDTVSRRSTPRPRARASAARSRPRRSGSPRARARRPAKRGRATREYGRTNTRNNGTRLQKNLGALLQDAIQHFRVVAAPEVQRGRAARRRGRKTLEERRGRQIARQRVVVEACAVVRSISRVVKKFGRMFGNARAASRARKSIPKWGVRPGRGPRGRRRASGAATRPGPVLEPPRRRRRRAPRGRRAGAPTPLLRRPRRSGPARPHSARR